MEDQIWTALISGLVTMASTVITMLRWGPNRNVPVKDNTKLEANVARILTIVTEQQKAHDIVDADGVPRWIITESLRRSIYHNEALLEELMVELRS